MENLNDDVFQRMSLLLRTYDTIETLPWHTPDHRGIRDAVKTCISRLVQLQRPDESAEWLEKMNEVAVLAELKLYFSASSLQEYCDPSTLILRIKWLAQSILFEVGSTIHSNDSINVVPLASNRLSSTSYVFDSNSLPTGIEENTVATSNANPKHGKSYRFSTKKLLLQGPDESTLSSTKQVSCQGCSRVFIVNVLKRIAEFVKGKSLPGLFIFNRNLVFQWLQDSMTSCGSSQYYDEECYYGGPPFRQDDAGTYWTEPHQLYTWWKNNIERKTKFRLIQRDSLYRGTDNKQIARSRWCQTIMHLSDIIRTSSKQESSRQKSRSSKKINLVKNKVKSPNKRNANKLESSSSIESLSSSTIVDPDLDDCDNNIEDSCDGSSEFRQCASNAMLGSKSTSKIDESKSRLSFPMKLFQILQFIHEDEINCTNAQSDTSNAQCDSSTDIAISGSSSTELDSIGPNDGKASLKAICHSTNPNGARWVLHGKAFQITDIDNFTTKVVNKHFRLKDFSSFQKQLNTYGFQRLLGNNQGIISHPLFQKYRPELIHEIVRVPLSRIANDSDDLACKPHNVTAQNTDMGIAVTTIVGNKMITNHINTRSVGVLSKSYNSNDNADIDSYYDDYDDDFSYCYDSIIDVDDVDNYFHEIVATDADCKDDEKNMCSVAGKTVMNVMPEHESRLKTYNYCGNSIENSNEQDASRISWNNLSSPAISVDVISYKPSSGTVEPSCNSNKTVQMPSSSISVDSSSNFAPDMVSNAKLCYIHDISDANLKLHSILDRATEAAVSDLLENKKKSQNSLEVTDLSNETGLISKISNARNNKAGVDVIRVESSSMTQSKKRRIVQYSGIKDYRNDSFSVGNFGNTISNDILSRKSSKSANVKSIQSNSKDKSSSITGLLIGKTSIRKRHLMNYKKPTNATGVLVSLNHESPFKSHRRKSSSLPEPQGLTLMKLTSQENKNDACSTTAIETNITPIPTSSNYYSIRRYRAYRENNNISENSEDDLLNIISDESDEAAYNRYKTYGSKRQLTSFSKIVNSYNQKILKSSRNSADLTSQQTFKLNHTLFDNANISESSKNASTSLYCNNQFREPASIKKGDNSDSVRSTNKRKVYDSNNLLRDRATGRAINREYIANIIKTRSKNNHRSCNTSKDIGATKKFKQSDRSISQEVFEFANFQPGKHTSSRIGKNFQAFIPNLMPLSTDTQSQSKAVAKIENNTIDNSKFVASEVDQNHSSVTHVTVNASTLHIGSIVVVNWPYKPKNYSTDKLESSILSEAVVSTSNSSLITRSKAKQDMIKSNKKTEIKGKALRQLSSRQSLRLSGNVSVGIADTFRDYARIPNAARNTIYKHKVLTEKKPNTAPSRVSDDNDKYDRSSEINSSIADEAMDKLTILCRLGCIVDIIKTVKDVGTKLSGVKSHIQNTGSSIVNSGQCLARNKSSITSESIVCDDHVEYHVFDGLKTIVVSLDDIREACDETFDKWSTEEAEILCKGFQKHADDLSKAKLALCSLYELKRSKYLNSPIENDSTNDLINERDDSTVLKAKESTDSKLISAKYTIKNMKDIVNFFNSIYPHAIQTKGSYQRISNIIKKSKSLLIQSVHKSRAPCAENRNSKIIGIADEVEEQNRQLCLTYSIDNTLTKDRKKLKVTKRNKVSSNSHDININSLDSRTVNDHSNNDSFKLGVSTRRSVKRISNNLLNNSDDSTSIQSVSEDEDNI